MRKTTLLPLILAIGGGVEATSIRAAESPPVPVEFSKRLIRVLERTDPGRPIVGHGDTIAYSDNGGVTRVINARTGEELSSQPKDETDFPTPTRMIAYKGKFYKSHDNLNGTFYAFDAVTGKRDLEFSFPEMIGGSAYFLFPDGVLVAEWGSRQGSRGVQAWDLEARKLLWQSTEVRSAEGYGRALGQETFISRDAAGEAVFDLRTGEKLWSLSQNQQRPVAVFSGAVAFSRNISETLYDPRTGKALWKHDRGDGFALCLGEDFADDHPPSPVVLLANGGKLRLVDARTGTVKAEVPNVLGVVPQGVTYGEDVCVLTAPDPASSHLRVALLGLTDGKVRWHRRIASRNVTGEGSQRRVLVAVRRVGATIAVHESGLLRGLDVASGEQRWALGVPRWPTGRLDVGAEVVGNFLTIGKNSLDSWYLIDPSDGVREDDKVLAELAIKPHAALRFEIPGSEPVNQAEETPAAVMLRAAETAIAALQPGTGEERWRQHLAGTATGQVRLAAEGATAYAAVSDTAFGGRYEVRALDPAKQQPAWQWKAPAAISTLAAVRGGVLVCHATNASLVAAGNNGTVVWMADLGAPALEAFSDGKDGFVLAPSRLVGLDLKSGKVKWTTEFEGGPASTMRLLGKAKMLAVLFADGSVAGFDLKAGKQAWRFDADRVDAVAGDESMVYGVAGADVIALDGAKGAEKWRTPLGDGAAPPALAPVVAGDYVFVSPRAGEFRALAARDGAHAWTFRGDGQGLYEPLGAGPSLLFVRADGTNLLVFDTARLVKAIKGGEKEYRMPFAGWETPGR